MRIPSSRTALDIVRLCGDGDATIGAIMSQVYVYMTMLRLKVSFLSSYEFTYLLRVDYSQPEQRAAAQDTINANDKGPTVC